MSGMRTASRDFTEFLAGILTEHMGFKRGKLERCLFVHESNETRVVSHVDDPLICAKNAATLEKFWMQITKMVVIKRGGKLQYITGVRPDLMFALKCLSYKLGSPTLADLIRAKKTLRYLKRTRDLNLYLTIPALKPPEQDLMLTRLVIR